MYALELPSLKKYHFLVLPNIKDAACRYDRELEQLAHLPGTNLCSMWEQPPVIPQESSKDLCASREKVRRYSGKGYRIQGQNA